MSVILHTSAATINIYYREEILANGWKYRFELRPRSYDEDVDGIAVATAYNSTQVPIPDGVIQSIKTIQEYDKRKLGMPNPHEFDFTLNLGKLKEIADDLGVGDEYGLQLATMYEYLLNNYIYKDVKLDNCSEATWDETHNPIIKDLLITNMFALYTDYGSGGDVELYDYFTQTPFDQHELSPGELLQPINLESECWYKWALQSITWEHIYTPVREYRDAASLVYNHRFKTRDGETDHTYRSNWYNLLVNSDVEGRAQNKWTNKGFAYYSKVTDLDRSIENILKQFYEVFTAHDATAVSAITLNSASHSWYKQNTTTKNSAIPGDLIADNDLYFLAKVHNLAMPQWNEPVHAYPNGRVEYLYNFELKGGFLSEESDGSFGDSWDTVYEYLSDFTEGKLLNFTSKFDNNELTFTISTVQDTSTNTFELGRLQNTKLQKKYERLIQCESSIAGISETGMFTDSKQRAGKSPVSNKYVLPPVPFSNTPAVEWGSSGSSGLGCMREVYSETVYNRCMFYLDGQDKMIPGASSSELIPVRCHDTNYININSSLYISDTTLESGSLSQGQKVVGYDSVQQGKGYYFSFLPTHNKSLTKDKADRYAAKDDNDNSSGYNSPKNTISWNQILQQIGRYGGIGNSLAIMCLVLFSRSDQALLEGDLIDFDSDIMSNKVGDKLQLSDAAGIYTDHKLNLEDSNYCELLSCETDWETCTNAVGIYFYGDDDDDASKNFDYQNKAT